MIADGDAHILASSGLILINQPQAARIPYAPLYGVLEDGSRSGELNFRFEAIHNAWEYEYQLASSVGPEGVPEWGDTVRTTHSQLNPIRSEEHTSELQSLMRISYAVYCLKKKKYKKTK